MKLSTYEPTRKYFDDTLYKNLCNWQRRIENKFPSILILDGGLGSAKTSSAVQIADCYSEMIGQEWIDLKSQLARNGDEFIANMEICIADKKRALIYDEAGDFSSGGTLTKFNRTINSILDKHRVFKIFIIICLPLASYLAPESIQKNMVRGILHLKRKLNCSYADYKAFSLQRLFFIRDKMTKLAQKSYAYKINRVNFRGRIYQPFCRQDEIDRYSTEGKKRDSILASIRKDGLLAYSDISQKLFKSHVWVQKSIKQLRLKPVKIIKQKHYYHPDIVDRLADYHIKQ